VAWEELPVAWEELPVAWEELSVAWGGLIDGSEVFPVANVCFAVVGDSGEVCQNSWRDSCCVWFVSARPCTDYSRRQGTVTTIELTSTTIRRWRELASVGLTGWTTRHDGASGVCDSIPGRTTNQPPSYHPFCGSASGTCRFVLSKRDVADLACPSPSPQYRLRSILSTIHDFSLHGRMPLAHPSELVRQGEPASALMLELVLVHAHDLAESTLTGSGHAVLPEKQDLLPHRRHRYNVCGGATY
jgi:hypothetical protein